MEFWQEEPNLIRSDDGSVRIHGRAGLTVELHGQEYSVSSEMLAEPMSIALFTRGTDRVNAGDPDEVYDFTRRALESIGFTVESD